MTTFAVGGIYDPPEAARYLRAGSSWRESMLGPCPPRSMVG